MTDQATKKRRGCFFYGCITSLVLLVILGLILFILYRAAVGMVNRYTDTSPMPLPRPEISQADMDILRQRVDAFRDAVKAERATPPLVLTGDEVNALLARDPSAKELGDYFSVSIEGDKLKAQVSFPLARLGIAALKNRYFNGSGTFTVALRNGLLAVEPVSLQVRGKPLPERWMSELRNVNFAEEYSQDPEIAAGLEKLESVKIKDGKLTIVPRENR